VSAPPSVPAWWVKPLNVGKMARVYHEAAQNCNARRPDVSRLGKIFLLFMEVTNVRSFSFVNDLTKVAVFRYTWLDAK
jgi:hypothetical protein